jgi:hypothetical protein
MKILRAFQLLPKFERYFLVFGFFHGEWLTLADDVSELFVGSIFKGKFSRWNRQRVSKRRHKPT